MIDWFVWFPATGSEPDNEAKMHWWRTLLLPNRPTLGHFLAATTSHYRSVYLSHASTRWNRSDIQRVNRSLSLRKTTGEWKWNCSIQLHYMSVDPVQAVSALRGCRISGGVLQTCLQHQRSPASVICWPWPARCSTRPRIRLSTYGGCTFSCVGPSTYNSICDI